VIRDSGRIHDPYRHYIVSTILVISYNLFPNLIFCIQAHYINPHKNNIILAGDLCTGCRVARLNLWRGSHPCDGDAILCIASTSTVAARSTS
jgi:hypothetical protein